MSINVYIEQLSVGSVGFVLSKLTQFSKNSDQAISLYYIDGTPLAIQLMEWFCQSKGWNMSQLPFELLNIREAGSGDLIRLCIPFDYLWKIKKSILDFDWLPEEKEQAGLRMFLEKSAICGVLLNPRSLTRTIYLIHVVQQHMEQEKQAESVFILFERLWKQVIADYAQAFGIKVEYIKNWIPINIIMDFGFSWSMALKQWVSQVLKIHFPLGLNWIRRARYLFKQPIHTTPDAPPRIGVFPQGEWHFKNDGFNSDYFFSLQSSLPSESILLLLSNFSLERHQKLKQNGVHFWLMNHAPPGKISTPFYLGPTNFSKSSPLLLPDLPPLEQRRIRFLKAEFDYKKTYWREFFEQQKVKVFTTWYKNEADHIPIAEAMRETGGIMTIWQRSYEEIPNVGLTLYTDVAFGYSPWLVNTEKAQGSKVRYYVATGYLRDYSHALLKPMSLELRQQLHDQGCKKIVSIFDENSASDSRWHSGEELQRKHYQFWAEKVLEQPWLGVIFKPKVPKTLRMRLGEDVANLLDEAKKTGRLLILDTSAEHSSAVPPVLAAMASDISIQGHLCAGTTAMQSALAGVPSIMVDYEGWKRSRLYQLGEGLVAFPDYENLWNVLQQHWKSENGIPGLGDWSPLLDDFDPFRDGRAAERMGDYLHALLNGLVQGIDREIVMADVAEMYAKRWGPDKVVTI